MAINFEKAQRAIRRSPGVKKYVEDVCDEIIAVAKEIFVAEEVKNNDARTSETSPPKYLSRFGKHTNADGDRAVYNKDPGAVFVEFGAHPGGGETEVMKYAPMRRALDIVVQRRNDG